MRLRAAEFFAALVGLTSAVGTRYSRPMHPLRLLPLALALSAFACTKKDSTAPTAAPAGSDASADDHHAEPGHADKHKFEGGVKSLHDVLAPLWHAPHDDARPTNTCAAVADLVAKATAIEAEAVPAAAGGKDEAWKAGAADLTKTTKELETLCAGDRKDFEAAFKKMHESFHALIEIAGEKHD